MAPYRTTDEARFLAEGGRVMRSHQAEVRELRAEIPRLPSGGVRVSLLGAACHTELALSLNERIHAEHAAAATVLLTECAAEVWG